MEKKNLRMILNEGGYINYRSIFRDLEEDNSKDLVSEEIDWDESDSETELPDWIMNKWKKYDMKDWER